jgi:FkbM family methyltransferase
MGMMQKLFEKLPENRWKNEFRFWVAQSPMSPQGVRRTCPLVGYEYVREIKEGDIVVDAGAFTGDFTVYASRKVGSRGHVLAFEPDPNNLRRLNRNLRGELKNVTIIEKGLWINTDTLTFRMGDSGLTSGTTAMDSGSKASDISVNVTSLDEELRRRGIHHIDVLKMDIEGAEIEALMGAQNTLRDSRAYVCIATYHIRNGHTTSGPVEQQLKDLGFHTFSGFPMHLTTYGWKPDAKPVP